MKAKFVKEHPSLVGELDIYDLYCSGSIHLLCIGPKRIYEYLISTPSTTLLVCFLVSVSFNLTHLSCIADDKRRSAMQISDTRETEDDTLIRVTSRKRARDDALVRLQTQKFTAVEKRRKADSEAKKKATTHLSAMATSVERQAELHEEAVAVSEKLATETLRHMDAAEVAQRKHTAVLERIAAALEGIHTSIGRYGAPTSMSVAATNSTTSAGDN